MKRDLIFGYGLLFGEGIVGSGAMLYYAWDRGRYEIGAIGASLFITVVLFSAYVRLHACFLDTWEEAPSTDND